MFVLSVSWQIELKITGFVSQKKLANYFAIFPHHVVGIRWLACTIWLEHVADSVECVFSHAESIVQWTATVVPSSAIQLENDMRTLTLQRRSTFKFTIIKSNLRNSAAAVSGSSSSQRQQQQSAAAETSHSYL